MYIYTNTHTHTRTHAHTHTQTHTQARFNLGALYIGGHGVSKDYAKVDNSHTHLRLILLMCSLTVTSTLHRLFTT